MTIYPPPLLPRARTYLLTEIKAGRTDSGLPQRFVEWARREPGGSLGNKEGIALFLTCCVLEGMPRGSWLITSCTAQDGPIPSQGRGNVVRGA